MCTTTRDRTDDLHALEELWAAPAYGESPGAAAPASPLVPGGLVAGGWLAFFVAVMAFQPGARARDDLAGLWATAVSVVQIVLLLGAAAIGPLFARLGFAAPRSPARSGSCSRSTAARPSITSGNWWLVELGAALALTGLAAVGLAQRLRR